MKISGRHIQKGASLLVNGSQVNGSIESAGTDLIEVTLATLPDPGMNMLQVRNPNSYLSNEFIFFAETEKEAVQRYQREPAYVLTAILNSAIVNDNPKEARIVLEAGAEVNVKHKHFEFERPPLILAAMYGRTPLVEELLRRGADVNIQDKSGITALHEAARMCRLEICKALLAAGAKPHTKDNSDKRPADLTSQFVRKGHFGKYFAPYRVNITLDHDGYLLDRAKVRELLAASAKTGDTN